jgi:hypothetical protein
MVTFTWVSITDSVASRDCDITDDSGAGVPAGHFIRSIADMPDTGLTDASTRWAIVIIERMLPQTPVVGAATSGFHPERKGYVVRFKRYQA